MPSQSQNCEFATHLIPGEMLDTAIEWIRGNLDPDDVFPRESLVQYVADTSSPEDVFPEVELARWAENNGFVKAEDA